MLIENFFFVFIVDDYLILVDGFIFIFCVYYVLLLFICKLDGLLVGVVFGFCNMLWKLLEEGLILEEGDELMYFVVIFDYFVKIFCNDIYLEYKVYCLDLLEDLVL